MNLKERFFSNVRGDLFGGITAGIVALPLALGFGVASGIENGAAAGLYGAIAVGICASLFGGTPSQVSGPTGPMTVVVAGIVGSLAGDASYIFIMVALAGVLQIVLGVARVGRYVNYIPYPVVSGFMSGIGVIIIILQLAQLVGHPPEPGTVAAIADIPNDFQNVNVSALLLGLGTFAIIYGTPRLTKVVPGTLVALVVMTTISSLLALDVPRIGEIPRGLPKIIPLDFEVDKLQLILVPALMLAVVGSIDSLLTSLVADAITKTKHDSERELMGQGIGNVVSGLIGGLPGAGATMRTVVNVKSGGRGPLSGVIHGLLLISVLLALAPLAEVIPHAVLAGILITVGIGIIDVKGLRHTRSAPIGDVVVMLVVLSLTVFVDLMWAVAIGMVMASMILLKRLSDLDPATHSPLVDIAAHRPWIPPLEVPEKVLSGLYLVEVHGTLFFGNAGPLQRKLDAIRKDADAVVLHMGDVRYMDQSGVYAMAELIQDLQKSDAQVYVAALRPQAGAVLRKLDVVPGVLPAERVFKSAEEAVKAAAAYLEGRANGVSEEAVT